ncbi:hypothetical protein TL16_g08429 [Triparma laevis f. inornata]|uniref:Uncharacterized protein n=2 Tax=Triparma laevis TaxID=1534972 RepID=A0A9W7FH17_9STRA|nr:hypothetical protein TL16_g08429 [Triparma laevis f. inornata]GMI11941.1 hypothetical protein TrLO_g5748 [Triparma laevis f. longispina]
MEVSGCPTTPITLNQSPPTASELISLSSLRTLLLPTLSLPHIAPHLELISDWKLLRFLHGYSNNIEDAKAAYERMSDFRLEYNVGYITL